VSYSDDLRHPKWQRRRLEILSRAEFRCERCNADDRPLHVHHKRYVEGFQPWDYADEDLIALCEVCHQLEHDPRKALVTIAAELRPGDFERLIGYALCLSAVGGQRRIPLTNRMAQGAADFTRHDRPMDVDYYETHQFLLDFWSIEAVGARS
jgi:hypothetical protein